MRLALGLAALLALALSTGRAAVALAMDDAHGVPLDFAAWRVGAALAGIVLHGAAAGLLAAWILRVRPEGTDRRTPPRAVRAAVVLVLAFLFLLTLAGWLAAPAAWTPAWATPRGRVALAVLGLGALGMAWIAERLATWSRARQALARAPVAGTLVVLLAAAPWIWGVFVPPPRVEIEEVVLDLLDDPEAWTAERSNAAAGPGRGVLCPSEEFSLQGGDRPTLVMPPPCEVVRRLPGTLGPLGRVRLECAIGVDQNVALDLEQAVRFRFELFVNGARRFDDTIPMQPSARPASTGWRPVSAAGLQLQAGDELRLRTTLLDDDGSEIVAPPPLPVGFSDLVLNQVTRRPASPSSAESPAVVLVVMDTLRADRLGAYGCARGLTPNLDALAGSGTTYLEAYATSSWTWPSTASIFTGMLPAAHGVTSDASCHLDHSLDTLAEVLARRGWVTAGFSGNPLIVADKNFDQGFGTFDSQRTTFRKSDKLVPLALEWLERHAGLRVFLYLHLVDTHFPHRPRWEDRQRFAGEPPPGIGERTYLDYTERLRAGEGTDIVPPEHLAWFRDVYDACVSTGDWWVGQVLQRIEALGLGDETLVIFTSEHGEGLLDHGLLTHGDTLHGELVRVPLILAGPGIPRGRRVSTPVSNRHIGPTLARLAGAPWTGLPDALDVRQPGALAGSPVYFSTEYGAWRGARDVRLTGVRSEGFVLHAAADGGAVVYDLERDPGERRDIAGQQPDLVRSLLRLVAEREAHDSDRRPGRATPAGEGTRRLLEQIGYIGGDDR